MTLARELADTAGRPQVYKNLLINGGMNVWQRSTSLSVSTDGYSTVDRFLTRIRGGAVYTISRSTYTPSAQGFGYSLKFDNTTADASPTSNDFTLLEQRIEGQNLQHLLKGTSSAKSLTLSFHIKSNLTGTFIARLYDNDNARSISKSYTISSANTWEKKEIVFEGDQTGVLDNDSGASLYLQLWFSAGTDYTSGTLQTTWGSSATIADIAPGISNLSSSTSNELYITGCQLEVGSTASGFEFEPYASTLAKCQRYYFEQREGGIFGISNVTNVNFRVPLPVTMRVAPSASLGGSGFRVGDMVSVGFFTSSPSIVVNYNGPTIAGVRVSGLGGMTAYRTYLLEPSGSYTGYIKLDAEL